MEFNVIALDATNYNNPHMIYTRLFQIDFINK